MKKILKGNLLALIIPAFVFVLGGYFLLSGKTSEEKDPRIAYEKMLAEKYYSLARVESEGSEEEEEEKGKRPDQPDKAFEQDFRRTMDPALGRPARERLEVIYDLVKNQKRNRLNSASPTWNERGPNNVGGRTRAMMFDPNDGTGKKVWAGGVAGGLWYCNDITLATPVWNKVNDFWDNMAVGCIAYDPASTQTFYVGTGEGWYNADALRGEGIWKTTDGGVNWTRLSSTTGANFRHIQKMVINATGVYIATRSNGIMRSTNGGTSWTKVLGSGTQGDAIINSGGDMEIGADGTIYASLGVLESGGGVYSSTTGNAGAWTKLNTGANGFPTSGFHRTEIAVAPSNANILYAVVQSSNYTVLDIFISTNKGSTWTATSKPDDADPGIPASDFSRGQAWYDLAAAVDPANANTLFVGAVDLFKSTNSGSSWTQIAHWYGGFGFPEVHADQHVIAFKPGSSSAILFGNDGGLHYTTNGNTSTPTFTSKNSGYNVTQFYSCAMNPNSGSNVFLAGAQDNGTQRFSTAGVGNTIEVYGGDGAFCFIDQDNANFAIASYVYNNFYFSNDGGQNFNTTLSDDSNTGDFINPADYDDRENILYSASSSSEIQRVKNVSTTPSTATTFTISGLGSMASHIRVSPYATAGTSNIFVGTDAGRLFKVTNAHATTPSSTEITGASFPTGSISCIEIGASENELLVTFSNYGVTSVFYTNNGGTNWSSKEGNLPDMPVRWALFNPLNRNEVILATEVGVWYSSNLNLASPTWAASNSGLANTRVDMLQHRSSDHTVIAATHGRGLFSSTNFVTASQPPVANFIANKTTACTGETITFTDQSTNVPTSWAWVFTGGSPSASTSQNPTVTYSSPGTYSVTLTATNTLGASTPVTKTDYITINASPNTSAITGSANICASDSADYSVTNTAGSTYAWTINGGTKISGGNSNAIRIVWNSTAGAGSVTVKETNSSSCQGTNVVLNITKKVKPIIATITGNINVCENSTENYSVTNNAGSTYAWVVTGGTITSGNTTNAITVDWTNAGNGNVSVTETNSVGCNSIPKQQLIQKHAIPGASFNMDNDTVYLSQGATVNFTNTSTGFQDLNWNFGDGNNSTQTNPSHQYQNTGTFVITLTASNSGCLDTALKTIIVLQETGLLPNKLADAITVFPNPANNILTIKTDQLQFRKVQLMDMNGKLIKETKQLPVDLNDVNSGTYIARIYTDKGFAEKKVLIKK
jgi:PKD repeat protein